MIIIDVICIDCCRFLDFWFVRLYWKKFLILVVKVLKVLGFCWLVLEVKGLWCYVMWVIGKLFKCNEIKIEILVLFLEFGNYIYIGLYNLRRVLGLLYVIVVCCECGVVLGLVGDVFEDFVYCWVCWVICYFINRFLDLIVCLCML